MNENGGAKTPPFFFARHSVPSLLRSARDDGEMRDLLGATSAAAKTGYELEKNQPFEKQTKNTVVNNILSLKWTLRQASSFH